MILLPLTVKRKHFAASLALIFLSCSSAAFLVLYGVALAIEGWGVVASLKIYPPFAGAAVSAVTLVVAFGFAVSRPCLTLEVWVLLPSDFFDNIFSYLSF